MQNKRAQGISLNTIIIAAIALIVLVVLVAIFTGRISMFSKGYDDTSEDTQSRVCNAQGGTCASDCDDIRGTPHPNPPEQGWIDCGEGYKCCV